MKAVDYVMIRADGLSQLHVHGALETPDGARIALSARGTSVPNTTTGESDIRLNAELHTTSPDYAWLNTTAVWVKGTASMITGQLLLTGYAA